MAFGETINALLVGVFACSLFCSSPNNVSVTGTSTNIGESGNVTNVTTPKPTPSPTTPPGVNHTSSITQSSASHKSMPISHSTSVTTATVSPSHHTSSPLPHPSATTLPGNSSSSVFPPTSGNRTVPTTASPTPDCNEIRDELKKEKQYKWVATAFVFIFAFVIIVLVIALCRMRRIYRELEGDSSLSRLI